MQKENKVFQTFSKMKGCHFNSQSIFHSTGKKKVNLLTVLLTKIAYSKINDQSSYQKKKGSLFFCWAKRLTLMIISENKTKEEKDVYWWLLWNNKLFLNFVIFALPMVTVTNIVSQQSIQTSFVREKWKSFCEAFTHQKGENKAFFFFKPVENIVLVNNIPLENRWSY